MQSSSGDSGEALAPVGGGDPEVAGVSTMIVSEGDMRRQNLTFILPKLGIDVKNPEGFEVTLKIKRIKQSSGDYKNCYSLVPNTL